MDNWLIVINYLELKLFLAFCYSKQPALEMSGVFVPDTLEYFNGIALQTNALFAVVVLVWYGLFFIYRIHISWIILIEVILY